MLNAIVLVLLWCWLPLAIVGYLFTRRGLTHCRALFIFDSVAIPFGMFLCVAFFWREITGHISEDAWLDERPWMGLLAPIYVAVISILFFMVAATIRKRIFSKPQSDVTRAV